MARLHRVVATLTLLVAATALCAAPALARKHDHDKLPDRWERKHHLNVKKNDKKGIQDFRPQIMVFSNGDLSSFEITLQREGGGDKARVYTDEQSNILMLLPGDTAPQGAVARTVQRR